MATYNDKVAGLGLDPNMPRPFKKNIVLNARDREIVVESRMVPK